MTRDGLPNPSRETKFSGTNADREIFIFPVQLTTCRTSNLTQLIHTLAMCVTIHSGVIYLFICFLFSKTQLLYRNTVVDPILYTSTSTSVLLLR